MLISAIKIRFDINSVLLHKVDSKQHQVISLRYFTKGLRARWTFVGNSTATHEILK